MATAPTVTTQAVGSIYGTTALGNGNVTSDGGAAITTRGICWNTSANPTTANSKTAAAGTTGIFTAAITGLTVGTLYHVRAYATNSVGTSYGADVTFTASTILASSLTSYWKYDEASGNATDTVGGLTMTTANCTYSAAKMGNGLNMNNTTSTASCNMPLNLNNDFTINFWYKGDYDTINWQWIMSTFDLGAPMFLLTHPGYIRICFGPWFTDAITSQPYGLDTTVFNMITVVRNGTNILCYVNGSQYGTPVGSAPIGFPTSGSFKLNYDTGSYQNTQTHDECGMWSRALLTTEISQLYRGGAGNKYPFSCDINVYDTVNVAETIIANYTYILSDIKAYYKFDEVSGDASDLVGSKTLTNEGSMTYSVQKVNNGAVFTGSSDFFGAVPVNLNQDFTINFWVSRPVAATSWDWILNFNSYGGVNNDALTFTLLGGQLYLAVGNWTDYNVINTPNPPGALTAATLWMLTLRRSRNVFSVFYNGIDSAQDLTYAASHFPTSGNWKTSGPDGEYAIASTAIDEMGWWQRALSIDELAQLYKNNLGNQYPFSCDISVFDSFNISDGSIEIVNAFSSVFNLLSISENITLVNNSLGGISVYDILNVSENFVDEGQLSTFVSETLNVSEDITLVNNQLGGISVYDILNVSENFVDEGQLSTFVSETLNLSEDVVLINNQLGGIFADDTLNVSEDIITTNDILGDIFVFDILNTSEDITITNDLLGDISIFDTINISEDVIPTNDALGAISVFETLFMTENIVEPEISEDVSVFDTLNLSENFSLFISSTFGDIFIFDSLGLSEDLTSIEVSLEGISIFEILEVSDLSAVSIFGISLEIPVFDNLELSDSSTQTNSLMGDISVFEIVNLSELLFSSGSLGDVTVFDEINLSENLIDSGQFNVSTFETITLLGGTGQSIDLGNILVIDSIQISENNTENSEQLGDINIFEAIDVSEDLRLLQTSFISTFDSIEVSENFIEGGQFYLGISDTVNLSDFLITENELLGPVNVADQIPLSEYLCSELQNAVFVFDNLDLEEGTSLESFRFSPSDIRPIGKGRNPIVGDGKVSGFF